MADERQPEQAMPQKGERDGKPRPTQPTKGHPRKLPKKDDDGFGGFMGHGGQSDVTYEGPEEDGEGENPNAAAEPD
jgi:hypothetical protein